jgi:hypothetical protein
MNRDDVRTQVAELIAEVSDGQVPADAALAGDVPLTSLGLTSFGFVRLTDAVAARYGVAEGVDGDLWEADAVDRIADRILATRA